MNEFFELQQTHLALAQYYRWYQVYEVPFTERRIENQKDILSEDVEIISAQGSIKGKDGLENRLKVFKGWLNAHHVQQVEVSLRDDKKISLEADILYQNIRPDNSKYSYTIHYSALLESVTNGLPLFTRLELKPTGEVKEFRFESAYPENRVKSFLHYWLYLIETCRGNSARLKELLGKEFMLQLHPGQKIHTLTKLEESLKTDALQRTSSIHQYKNLKVADNKDNTFRVSVDLERTSVNAKNERTKEETHQEWVLELTMDERFARIKKMTVSAIKPLEASTGETAER